MNETDDDDDDRFIPKHTPDQFRKPQPLKCPPYEPDPSQSCPHLHCVACKFKLIRGIEDEKGLTCYSCFQCDAVYVAQG
jgi:hypothetical protein